MDLGSLVKNTSVLLVFCLSACAMTDPECHPKLYDADVKGVLNQTTTVSKAFMNQTSGFECSVKF